MSRRLVMMLVSVATTMIISSATVFAHGEAADEPFLKVLTAAFYDVTVEPNAVQVGDEVTIIGKVRVLDTWPYTMPEPDRAYVTAVVPGPVFVMKERYVNGDPAPHSVFVERGQVYEFRMVLVARMPSNEEGWHVHPGVAFEDTGTLLGPGEYVTVSGDVDDFEFPLTLLSGTTINLETYGTQFIWWWNFAGFVIGVVWMFWWTWWGRHRTVTNLAVTIQLPLNDDAPDIGLITPTDHKWCNIMAGATLLLFIGGWFYMTSAAPVRLPQQTAWLTPQHLDPDPMLAEVRGSARASFDENTGTLIMPLEVTNLASSPITVTQWITGMVTFVNGTAQDAAALGPPDFVGVVEVEPNTPIAPGATRELTLRITSPIFNTERLIPIADPQQTIAGLLRVENVTGAEQLVTVSTQVLPTTYRSSLLPVR